MTCPLEAAVETVSPVDRDNNNRNTKVNKEMCLYIHTRLLSYVVRFKLWPLYSQYPLDPVSTADRTPAIYPAANFLG
jgi:hypothetical protein